MTNKPTIPEVINDFQAYYKQNPNGGSLHIVFEDGNENDASVKYCIELAKSKGDTEGERLGNILLTMSKTQRSKLPRMLEY